MISDKKLLKVFERAKHNSKTIYDYYTFDDFKRDAKSFLKLVRERDLVLSMEVSRSGMTRHFNSNGFNSLMNLCYHHKKDYDPVRVSGCGMDMHWYLIFTCCEVLATKKEKQKYNYNSLAGHQPLI